MKNRTRSILAALVLIAFAGISSAASFGSQYTSGTTSFSAGLNFQLTPESFTNTQLHYGQNAMTFVSNTDAKGLSSFSGSEYLNHAKYQSGGDPASAVSAYASGQNCWSEFTVVLGTTQTGSTVLQGGQISTNGYSGPAGISSSYTDYANWWSNVGISINSGESYTAFTENSFDPIANMATNAGLKSGFTPLGP